MKASNESGWRPAPRVWALLMVGFGALALACQGGQPEPAGTPDAQPAGAAPSTQPLVAAPARDFGGVPAHLVALAGSGGTFRGGYRTHQVEIADGQVALTPSSFNPITRGRDVGTPFVVETTRIALGDVELAGGASATRQAGVNAIEIVRSGVVERVTNREDGVEQSWHFAAAPVGTGDLVVEVAVSGHRYDVGNDNGLHFKGPSKLGVRYSHGVWLDSAGGEWEIPAVFEDDQIRLTIPEEILALSQFPAVLDPTITGELLTDVPAIGSLGANSRAMDVASSGSEYFVVWQDQRQSLTDDIFATRVSTAGVVTTTTGIDVNSAAGVQQNPSAAWVGNGYVVAWENVVAAGNSDIVAAFVSTSNVVTQLGTVAGTAANETLPTVVGRGSEALVVWQDGADVRAARFSGGAMGAAFAVASGANVEKDPAASADPAGDYLVTFTEVLAGSTDDIRGQLVTAAGALSGAVFNVGSQAGAQSTSAVGFDGTNFVAAWSTGGNIAGARVGPTGTVLDTTPVTINAGTSSQLAPDVACGAAACFVAWEDLRTFATTSRDVYGALLNTSASLAITTNDILISNVVRTQVTPAVAMAGTEWLVTWPDVGELDYTSIRGSRVSAAGAALDSAGLTLTTNYSRSGAPQLAQSPTHTDVYWSDSQIPDTNVVHTRFATTQADTTPKVVSSAFASQLFPSPAYVGSNFLAVWQDSRNATRDIYMARVAPSTGVVVDSAGIQVSGAANDQLLPRIASAGTSALVVWQDRRNGNFDIYGALVDQAGTVTVNDISVCAGAGDQTRPAVAYDPVNAVYLVAWSDPSGATVDIRAARISAAGAVLDASCGTVVSSAAGSQLSPDVARGLNEFLVVWNDRRNGDDDIYGARVTTNGSIAVQDATGIAISQVVTSSQSQPTVAYGGGATGGYAVAWADTRNAGTTSTDIWGTRVLSTGAVEAAFVIAAAPEAERAPDIAPGAATASPFTVTYNKNRPDLDSERVQVRRITFATAGGQPCTTGSQCGSGFCSDSVCCDTACGGVYNVRDCQACSVTRGAAVNGTCGIIPAATSYICRYYAEVPVKCDLVERCDGVSADCPPDLGQKQGQACTTSGGGAGVCPANSIAGAPHLCQ